MKAKVRTFNGTTSPEVTQRETDHRKLAREAAAEGFVLLENKDHFLPLAKGSKVGLYGAGAIRTIKGGTGSGDVNERDSVNIFQGMKNAGYDVTSSEWLEDYDKLYVQARLDWKNEIFTKLNGDDTKFFDAYSATPFFMPSGNPIDEEKAAADGADTAFFVLARIAGENKDRFDTEGDYFISKEEKAILAQVSRCYKNVVLVINTGGLMDLAFVEEFDNIRSILQYVQAGQEGGNAFADVVSGDVTPSGKMTDTWAKDYYDYPGAEVYSYKSGDLMKEKYEEGIFVGYRYFDTFEVPVRYSFGYGMSYTDFEIRTDDIKVSGRGMMNPKVSVTVTVTNTGDTYAGKEVVQIYASCPQGRLVKEFRRLAGFGKTKLLAPKESQTMTITFPLYQLTSYEEESASWILEPGMYGIWIGNDLNTSVLSGALELDEKAVMTACENICPLKEELNEIVPDAEKVQAREAAWQKEVKEKRMSVIELKASEIPTEKVDYQPVPEELPGKAGKIVESLSVDQLALLATGDPGRAQGNALGSAGISVPGAAAETSPCASEEPWNVTTIALVDGPAGLRITQKYKDGDQTYYQYATAWPIGTLLAQTWDTDQIYAYGEGVGEEMEEFGIGCWLAPGMNIHRNALCGRNFEYYSEDPVVVGITGTAATLGVQSNKGVGVTIKHYALNSQETNRNSENNTVSERAIREIYLKGFEAVVKQAQPMAIMTSYNQNNGRPAADDYDLCTAFARDEWGFQGMIMTDWGGGQSVPMYEMHAGNDLVCPGKGAAQIIKGFKSDPDWNGKGYVNMTTISYQDQTDPNLPVITKDVPNFGGYELNKEGTEVQSTTVNGDADADHSLLCDEAWKAIEDGYATYEVKDVRNWWTGTTTKQTTVSYKVNSNKDGQTNKQVISLGDLQKAAINICNFVMNSTEFAKEHGFTAQSLNEKYADILKDITSHSKDAVQSTIADKGLQKLINTVKDLDSSEYTADSWKALEDAVAAAKDVVAKADASQSEIDAAVNGIIDALGSLEYGVQTLHLETAIEAAEAILADPDNYVSVDALKAAVEAGKAVLANKEATQAEIDAAANAVLAELSALAENADRASLKKLVDAAEKLTDGKYTSDSIAKLNDAISKAKDALENGDEAAIAGAYEDLIDAITKLEMKGNKAALKSMLEKAAAILADTDAYVASTIDGLATVKADAQNVYDNADAVQSEINAAVKSLTLKIAAARLLGDVNGDGAVTTSDSVSVLAASAELTSLDADATASADVNGDGVADTLDAALILQTAAEK